MLPRPRATAGDRLRRGQAAAAAHAGRWCCPAALPAQPAVDTSSTVFAGDTKINLVSPGFRVRLALAKQHSNTGLMTEA